MAHETHGTPIGACCSYIESLSNSLIEPTASSCPKSRIKAYPVQVPLVNGPRLDSLFPCWMLVVTKRASASSITSTAVFLRLVTPSFVLLCNCRRTKITRVTSLATRAPQITWTSPPSLTVTLLAGAACLLVLQASKVSVRWRCFVLLFRLTSSFFSFCPMVSSCLLRIIILTWHFMYFSSSELLCFFRVFTCFCHGAMIMSDLFLNLLRIWMCNIAIMPALVICTSLYSVFLRRPRIVQKRDSSDIYHCQGDL